MFGLSILTPRVLWGFAVAAMIVGACYFVYTQGANSVQVAWDADKLDQSKQTIRALDRAAQVTADLQTTSNQITGAKNAQIADLRRSNAAFIAGMSDRPSRPGEGDLPSPSGNATGAIGVTGKGLYGQDAGFLAGESADAAELQLELKACYTQYKTARDKLK